MNRNSDTISDHRISNVFNLDSVHMFMFIVYFICNAKVKKNPSIALIETKYMKSTTTLFTYNKFNHWSALFTYIDIDIYICIKATATATTLAAAITATRRRSYTKEKKNNNV